MSQQRSDTCILGIDTSNYKTSAAILTGQGETVCDERVFLQVKEGMRGLRQSEALFQHVQNLPEIMNKMREAFGGRLDAVAYSTRPRAVEGSYMPCFTAGCSVALSIGAALDIPVAGFSHQEGHIEAALSSAGEQPEGDFTACHFSGGTCEVLTIKQKKHAPSFVPAYGQYTGERAFYDIEITGGTRDISYGQVLDRAGVSMGLSFPCGQELDDMALTAEEASQELTRIKVSGSEVHLSGFDTQLRNKLATRKEAGEPADDLIREAFEKIADSVVSMLKHNAEETGLNWILMSGGVSSSGFLRSRVKEELAGSGI